MHTPSGTAGTIAPGYDASAPTDRIERFFAENPTLETPYLVVDLDVVRNRYLRLRKALPRPDIYYAVKANPEPVVLRTLADLGSRFDVASVGEIDRCLDLGGQHDGRGSRAHDEAQSSDDSSCYSREPQLL